MADTSSGFFDSGGLGSTLLSYVPFAGGLLSSLFGESPESQRAKLRQEQLKQNQIYRDRAIQRAQVLKQTGLKDIAKNTVGQLGKAQSDVGRRAAAIGRTGETEAMLNPVTSNINESGSRTLEGATQSYDTGINNINSQFDANAMNIENDIASAPLDPSTLDQISGIASSASKSMDYSRYLDALRDSRSNVPIQSLPVPPPAQDANTGNMASTNYQPIVSPIKKNYSYLADPRLQNSSYRY